MRWSRTALLRFNLLVAAALPALTPSAVAADLPAALVDAKDAALQIEDSFLRGIVLDEIGAAEAGAGGVQSAISTANRAYPHDLKTLEAIGDQLSVPGDLGEVQAVGARLRGGGASTIMAVFAQHQAMKGEFDEALRATEKITAPELLQDTLKAIGKEQAGRGDYAGARTTLAAANAAYPPRRVSADRIEAVVAEAQITRGDVDAAHDTLRSIRTVEDRSEAMISAAGALAKKGDAVAARAWLEEALQPAADRSRIADIVTSHEPWEKASQLIREKAGAKILRFLALPVEVKAGLKERAFRDVASLWTHFQVRGYAAIAVACAEEKDMACVNTAMTRMTTAAEHAMPWERALAETAAKSLTFHVSAALIDIGAFEDAATLLVSTQGPIHAGWLVFLQKDLDETSQSSIEPVAQLHSVVILAKQSKFAEARSLALRIRPDRVPVTERGTAFRDIALLETRRQGAASAHEWVAALPLAEDRACALLGIAEAQLGTEDVHLPYSTIFAH